MRATATLAPFDRDALLLPLHDMWQMCLAGQPIGKEAVHMAPRSRSAAAFACELGLTLPWDEQSGDGVELEKMPAEGQAAGQMWG